MQELWDFFFRPLPARGSSSSSAWLLQGWSQFRHMFAMAKRIVLWKSRKAARLQNKSPPPYQSRGKTGQIIQTNNSSLWEGIPKVAFSLKLPCWSSTTASHRCLLSVKLTFLFPHTGWTTCCKWSHTSTTKTWFTIADRQACRCPQEGQIMVPASVL